MEAGVYLTHFVQVSRAGTMLHKPREAEPGKTWCGTGGLSPGRIGVDEAVGRKTSFCSKCFGAPKACGKLCSYLKRSTFDGGQVLVRCMRRCDLNCPALGKYMDVDERRHLCAAHLDGEPGEIEQEQE